MKYIFFSNTIQGASPVNPLQTRISDTINFRNLYVSGYTFVGVPCTLGVPNNPVYGLKIEGIDMQIQSNLFVTSFPLPVSGAYTSEHYTLPIKIAENGKIHPSLTLTITNAVDNSTASSPIQYIIWLAYD